MYKLLAADMDGTLLKDDKTISYSTYKAIQDARKKGIRVVLSTGRYLSGIKKYLKELNLLIDDEYAVTMNGSLIQNAKSGNILYKSLLTHDAVKYVCSIGNTLGTNVELAAFDYFIINKTTKLFELDSKVNDTNLKIMNFNDLSPKLSIFKIMFVDDGNRLDKLTQELPENIFNNFTVVRSGENYLEFLNKNTDKGSAIKILAKKLGIKSQDVICIGDAENDINMIKYAGLGIAMGNAYTSVKKAADYVTRTNEEDGVAHAIKKFILSENAS